MGIVNHIDLVEDPQANEKIKDLIKTLRYVSITLKEETCKEIVETLCSEGADMASNIAAYMPRSGLTESTVKQNDGEQTQSGFKGSFSLVGPEAIYEEFGTGEEGADNPHPMKNNFGLNAYNSGPFVSTHINPYNNRHYWFYKPMGGQPYFKDSGYTEGIPAGMPMYQGLTHIKNKKEEVIKEIVDKAIMPLSK